MWLLYFLGIFLDEDDSPISSLGELGWPFHEVYFCRVFHPCFPNMSFFVEFDSPSPTYPLETTLISWTGPLNVGQ